ncbi:MAG: UDP-N-acetylmuramate dehydrogenase [Chloroflexota bacterium]|nr:UDP-N-acetylmuramate dehydrogenase [Chloroflexota bacterium]
MSHLDRYAHLLARAEPLARFTAARLGGNADYVYVARTSETEMIDVVRAAWADDLPVRILGGGANVLVLDTGVRGLVVVNHVSVMQIDASGAAASPPLHMEESEVKVTAGMALTILARKLAAAGLSGFEWAASVPGTVGGAVVNNAGAHGGDMAGNVIDAEIATPDGVSTWTNADLAFDYRTSALKQRTDKRFLVTSARLRLTPDDPAAITARMDGFIAQRKRTQPPGASLGSIFKNPAGDYAGRLIEACALKSYTIGGAQVSPVHANFFINTGGATARDYLTLVETVQRIVHEQTGVRLETEIEIIG